MAVVHPDNCGCDHCRHWEQVAEEVVAGGQMTAADAAARVEELNREDHGCDGR